MRKVIEKLFDEGLNVILKHASNKINNVGKEHAWKNAVKKACRATEGIEETFANYIVVLPSVCRYFLWLNSNKKLDDVYKSFIISIANELYKDNKKNELAISLGTAILDNWFEMNKIDYLEFKRNLNVDRIVEIVNNREKLYREYFMLYNDIYANDLIRVYYPKNGESWINWNNQYSIDVRINLSKGTELGFCRVGCSYSRVADDESENFLKAVYINEEGDREILRFENCNLADADGKKILWVE